MAVTIADRIEQYIKLRDLIKEKDDAHKARMQPFRETLEKLNGLMLEHLNTLGSDSVKSSSGTVYRTTKTSVSLADPQAFMDFVIQTGSFEMLERSANKTAVSAFLAENNVLPPGTKMTQVHVVGVRRS